MNVLKLIASSSFITVNITLAKCFGLNEAVVLGALCSGSIYCEEHGLSENGYFPFSIELLQEKTTLSRKAQDSAIDHLVEVGVLDKQNKGVPCKRYFRVNNGKIAEFITVCPKGQTRLSLKDKLDCPQGTNYIDNNNIYITKKNVEEEYRTPSEPTDDEIIDSIKSAFNSQSNITAKIQAIPPLNRRWNNIMLCVKQYGFDVVLDAIKHLDENEFFQTWKPSFDWVVDPNNMLKIIEGNYKHNDKQTGDASKEWLEKWVAEDDEE